MSLPALALLISAVGALREVAPDWVRVEMAPREPLKLAAEGGQVLVALYSGDETHVPERRRGWYEASRTVEMAVQILLPPTVTATVGGVRATFETHTAGAEPVFAAVDRLIERAFNAPGSGAWGERWQSFVLKFDGALEARPFIAGETASTQIPGLDLSYPCEVIGSPVPGAPAGPWAALVAAMRADAYFAASASFVEALIQGEPVPPWQLELARTGLSRTEGDALGIGPFLGVDAQPPAETFVLKVEGRPDLVVTEDSEL